MVGNWVKNTMVGRTKNKKKHRLKLPKAVPKCRNMDQNINDSKSHISNSLFENIISSIQLFYVRPHVPVDIIRVFFNFRFSSRNSQNLHKLAKKITNFTIQFRSKNLIHFTNLKALDIENNILLQCTQKHHFLTAHHPFYVIFCYFLHLLSSPSQVAYLLNGLYKDT